LPKNILFVSPGGIPRSKFTREQINRMIDDTRRGRFYNKEGNLAVGNEPRMTLDDLNRYLQTLEYTSTFTLKYNLNLFEKF
jgi:hypothetical protein